MLDRVNRFGKDYLVAEETHYDPHTPERVIEVLERIRKDGTRVRLHYGDAQTGRDWGGKHGMIGRVGRSTGPVKIPILVYNRRSLGGGAILTHCIVRIETSVGGRVLYEHPSYHESREG